MVEQTKIRGVQFHGEKCRRELLEALELELATQAETLPQPLRGVRRIWVSTVSAEGAPTATSKELDVRMMALMSLRKQDVLPPPCEYVLFDGAKPGSGETYDWKALETIVAPWSAAGMAVVLAGGLDSANVGEAIRCIRPDVVDVSSGVEEPKGSGVKSQEAIKAFCLAVLKII
eukprot:GHVN01057125.1.p2 GENE.GHVN01057125.1~~GHVN01057125.1.p2  ORF type:complete len:174 (-),score=21.94 GHVN01057125.1:14-535(-)